MATLNEDSRRYLFDRSAPAVGDIAALESILSRKRYGVDGPRSGRVVALLAASALFALWGSQEDPDEVGSGASGVPVNSESAVGLTQSWEGPRPIGGEVSSDPEKSAPFVVLMGGETVLADDAVPSEVQASADLGVDSASDPIVEEARSVAASRSSATATAD